MSELGVMAVVVGGLITLVQGWLLLAPATVREAAVRFPRSRWAGWVLAAVAWGWVVVLVRDMPLGWFERYRMWLYVAAPVAYGMTVAFMAELLAARALGALMLLAGSPVLDAARWHPSAFRYVLVVLVYLWVVVGMALVLAPYRLRRTLQRWTANDFRCRLLGAAGVVLGLGLVGLGFRVF